MLFLNLSRFQPQSEVCLEEERERREVTIGGLRSGRLMELPFMFQALSKADAALT